MAYIYRKNDGLFIKIDNQVSNSVAYALTDVDPRTPVCKEIEEILLDSNEYSRTFIIENVSWKSGNNYPFFVTSNFSIVVDEIQYNNQTWVRRKFDSQNELLDIFTNNDYYYCFSSGNNNIYAKNEKFYMYDGTTFTDISSNCSWVNREVIITIPEGESGQPAPGIWILRKRKELSYENRSSSINNTSDIDFNPKSVAPSTKVVKEFIDSELGFDPTTPFKTIAFIQKGKFYNGGAGILPPTDNYIYYSNNYSGIDGFKLDNGYYEYASGAINVEGYTRTQISELAFACDLEFTNNSQQVTISKGELLINKVSLLPNDMEVPVLVNCNSLTQKINNDFASILKLLALGNGHYNYRNPFTEYIDSRIESFTNEILSNADDTVWNKYYNTRYTG